MRSRPIRAEDLNAIVARSCRVDGGFCDYAGACDHATVPLPWAEAQSRHGHARQFVQAPEVAVDRPGY